MDKPRDHFVVDRVGAVRLARLFSNIVSPPVIFALLGLFLALYELPPLQAFVWGAVYGLFASLMPILFVLYLLRSGRIVELHMSDTRERHLPYLVAVISSFVVLALLLIFDGPQLLRCLALINVVMLAAMGVINTRWLISFHSTAAMTGATIAGLVFGPVAGVLLLPLVALVVAVRLYLRRHTVAQVIAGLVLGVAAVLALSSIGCFAG